MILKKMKESFDPCICDSFAIFPIQFKTVLGKKPERVIGHFLNTKMLDFF